jgi:hypothetical protein
MEMAARSATRRDGFAFYFGSTFFVRYSPKVLKIYSGLLLYHTEPQKGSNGKIKCK